MQRRLGAFETAGAVTMERAAFNAVVVLHLDPLPSTAALRKALDSLQRRHPVLAARIIRRGRAWFFTPAGTRPIPVPTIDRHNDNTWEQAAEGELNTPIPQESGPLIRVMRVTAPCAPGAGELLLTFHHAVMDAPSGMALVEELLKACVTPAPIQEEAHGLGRPPEENFPGRFRPPLGRLAALPFLFRSLLDEARSLRDRQPRPAPGARGRIITLELTEPLSRKLYRTCRHREVSPAALAGAAMLLALHRERHAPRTGRFRHITFADLRPFLAPPREDLRPACCISMLRLTLHLGRNTGLWELAARLQAGLNLAARRGDRFAAALWSPFMMRTLFRFRRGRMAHTALSLSPPLLLPERFGPIRLTGLNAFVSNFSLGPEFTAQVRMFRGRMQWDMVFLDNEMDRNGAERIAARIRTRLEAAADDSHD